MPLDLVHNPYTPGAGQKPLVLVGREAELARFEAALRRMERGRPTQCALIVGRRGVGKTVLMNEFGRRAAARDWIVVDHELRPGGDLFSTAVRMVREAVLQIAPPSAWQQAARQVGALLAGIEVTYAIAGLSVSLGGGEERARAAAADVATDLTSLLVSLGEAAKEHGRGVVLLFDEVQFAAPEGLAALIAGLHKVAQRELPITLVAAGLPQTRGVLAEAASYAERMFDTLEVGALGPEDARRALTEPAGLEGARFDGDAVVEVLRFTDGYPFFLQVFGDHLWRHAAGSPIRRADALAVEPVVLASLDRGFFAFRTDKIPAAQRRYLRAMAEVGDGEVSSGEVAAALGMRSSAQAGQTREALIKKGLIYSPRLGYAAFSVPQFDQYLRRHFELEAHQPRRPRGAGDR